jgi:hypothetical protein
VKADEFPDCSLPKPQKMLLKEMEEDKELSHEKKIMGIGNKKSKPP